MTPRSLSCAAVLAALAVPAASAQAAPLELGDQGETRLRLDDDTADSLRAAGIRVRPVGPARGVTLLRFPTRGGELETATARGMVTHRGGLALTRRGRTVRLTSPTLRLTASPLLTALANGRRINVANVSTRQAQVGVQGAALTLTGGSASLTSGGAAALNRALRVRAFKRGTRLGTVTVIGEPKEVVPLRGGRTDVTFVPAAAQALASAGVAVGPIAPAAAAADGSVGFPIGRRSVVAAGLQTGTIDHGGGLKLVKGATEVSLTDFLVRIDATPSLAARLGYSGERTPLIDVNLGTATPVVTEGAVTVGPTTLMLNAGGAQAINALFGTAFRAGDPLATATVRAEI